MFQKNDDVKENEGQSVDQVESIEKVKEFLSLIPVNHLVQKKEPVDQINDEKKKSVQKKTTSQRLHRGIKNNIYEIYIFKSTLRDFWKKKKTA